MELDPLPFSLLCAQTLWKEKAHSSIQLWKKVKEQMTRVRLLYVLVFNFSYYIFNFPYHAQRASNIAKEKIYILHLLFFGVHTQRIECCNPKINFKLMPAREH